MIVRDEERFLPDCLTSAQGAVDEVVVVDTGSADRTREIARAAGAIVLDHAWNDDFAAPRNAAVRRARGDWVLQLDADERLAPGAAGALREAVRRARFDVGLLPLHDAAAVDAPPADVLQGRSRLGAPMSLPRLLRNAGGLEYRGIIHESAEEWFLRRRGRALHVDAPIIHLGAIPAVRAAAGKRSRNLTLLRRRCAAAPADVTALGYLAGELLEVGDVDAASDAVEQGWAALQAQPAWRSVLRLAVARVRIALRRGDPEKALATVADAEQRQGRSLDLTFLRGCAHELASRRDADPGGRRASAAAAAAAYADALALLPRPAIERLCAERASDIQIRRGHALLVAGRPVEANAAFEAALAADPAAEAARLGAAEALLDAGDAVGALRALEPLLDGGPDAWLLAAAATHALGAATDAALLLACARERLGAGLAAPHRRLRLEALQASAS